MNPFSASTFACIPHVTLVVRRGQRAFIQVLKLILKMRQCWLIHISDFINLVILCLHFHPGLVLGSSETGKDVGSRLIGLSMTLPSFRRYYQFLPTLVSIS